MDRSILPIAFALGRKFASGREILDDSGGSRLGATVAAIRSMSKTYVAAALATFALLAACGSTSPDGEPLVGDLSADGGAAKDGESASLGSGDDTTKGASDQGKEACDGLDNNGDGKVDEGCTCQAAATQPCFVGDAALAGKGACKMGVQTCAGGSEVTAAAWGACEGSGVAQKEVCGNKVDDDCNGRRLYVPEWRSGA
jgi:hypothetical protein